MITLRERDPIAADEWYYPLNGDMTPDNISGKSGKKAYFQCHDNPKHIYERFIYDTANKDGQHIGCPFCSGKRVFPGESDLLTKCPNATKLWDYDKNTINPRTLHANSTSKVYFKCKNGHEFKKVVYKFYRNPICKECDFLERSIVTVAPEVYDWWDYNKNKNDLPEKHLKTDSKRVWWKCPKCSYGWKAEIASRAISKFQCPCCDIGIVFKEGVNDALTRCPDIGLDWDYESNGNLKPNKIFINDKKVKSKIYWSCHICNYHWPTKSISTRIYFEDGVARLRKCPACAGKVADENTANITVTHPEIACEYAEELNEVPATKIRYGSGKERVWRCKKCKQIFLSTPAKRTSKLSAGGCPFCSGKLPIQGVNDFATRHPELLKEWDYTLNSIEPQNFTEFSTREVNWVCLNNKSHKWINSLRLRSIGFGRCPYCFKIEKRYKRMLADTHPELLPYWDYELNEYQPSAYSESSNRKVWWKCENSHPINIEIYHFTREGFHCPYCNEVKLLKGYNDVLTHYPEVETIWDIDGNNGLKADEVIYSCSYHYKFICSKGHKMNKTIGKMVEQNFECDYCEGRKLLPEFNSLGVRYIDLANEWDYEKNSFSPYDVLPSNTSYVYWICKTCGGKYGATIKDRVDDNIECPCCNNRRPNPGVNTLKAIYPILAEEFSLKNSKNSDNILSTNRTQFIWNCKICNTVWYATIEERVNVTKPCPGCSGERAIPGKTSFKALYPTLAKEYSIQNVFDSDEILPNYSITVEWHCSSCDMDWFDSVRNRVSGEAECPYCSGKKAIPGKTSFKALYPELMREWKYISNLLLVNPDYVLPSSTKEAWWECYHCDRSYSIKIKDRVNMYKRNKKSCPYCKGYRKTKRRYM